MASVTGVTYDKINQMVGSAIVGLTIDNTTGVVTAHTQSGQTLSVGSVSTKKNVDDSVSKAYPVGAVFMSMIATNPATQLGIGTWSAIGQGRVLVGVDPAQTEFSDSNKTGGEKTHVLTTAEMPKHTHTGAPHTHTINHDHADATVTVEMYQDAPNTGTNNRVTDVGNSTGGGGTNYTANINIPAYTGSSGAATAGTTGITGGDGAHNNLQPYLTCYMWKRTA